MFMCIQWLNTDNNFTLFNVLSAITPMMISCYLSRLTDVIPSAHADIFFKQEYYPVLSGKKRKTF